MFSISCELSHIWVRFRIGRQLRENLPKRNSENEVDEPAVLTILGLRRMLFRNIIKTTYHKVTFQSIKKKKIIITKKNVTIDFQSNNNATQIMKKKFILFNSENVCGAILHHLK